jgi:hypothetical protein
MMIDEELFNVPLHPIQVNEIPDSHVFEPREVSSKLSCIKIPKAADPDCCVISLLHYMILYASVLLLL